MPKVEPQEEEEEVEEEEVEEEEVLPPPTQEKEVSTPFAFLLLFLPHSTVWS